MNNKKPKFADSEPLPRHGPPGRDPSPRRARLLRWLWVSTLCLSLGCGAVVLVFGTSEIDSHGFLHEPLFGLIPVGLSLLLIAVVLAVLDMALGFAARRRRSDSR